MLSGSSRLKLQRGLEMGSANFAEHYAPNYQQNIALQMFASQSLFLLSKKKDKKEKQRLRLWSNAKRGERATDSFQKFDAVIYGSIWISLSLRSIVL